MPVQPLQSSVTGAIGDYGNSTNEDKDGTVDVNGDYAKVVLKQGSFTINAVAFNKVLNKTPPHVNKTNCGAVFTGSGPISLSGGTGAYVGIKGTITASLTFAFIDPKLADGKCNTSQKCGPGGRLRDDHRDRARQLLISRHPSVTAGPQRRCGSHLTGHRKRIPLR
jgi:hypothetical protein